MEGSSSSMKKKKEALFHVIHKVPAGDSPYVRAKCLQLVKKDHEAAIVWFWKAINSSDRVDSALKDMAVVMKQQDRSQEAIEAIKSFRHLCSKQAQESLIDLYKKCGQFDQQIQLLKQKLRAICSGKAFNGKTRKTARSHGKKIQVSIKQETVRILGNLGWAYMQQHKYDAAEVVYRKAQLIEPDANKACNLGLCLMRKGRFDDARRILDDVVKRNFPWLGSDESNKTVSRAEELLGEMEENDACALMECGMLNLEEEIMERLDDVVINNEWAPFRSKRLPVFEEISRFRDQMAC